MKAFDYGTPAELFPARRGRPSRHSSVGYRRFERVCDAIRFAIEDLDADLLAGAYLEVEQERFDRDGIRNLYERSDYPLERHERKPPAPQTARPIGREL